MKRDYIITSSARTMLKKKNPEKAYHLVFLTDQSTIQDFNLQLNHALLCGYHAYKIALESETTSDLYFSTKILIELQFFNLKDAMLVKELLIEKGVYPQLHEDLRKEGKEVAFVKGDRFSNRAL